MDVGFFARADLLACRVEGLPLLVRVQSQVVEASVGEAVAIVCGGFELLFLLIVAQELPRWLNTFGTLETSDEVYFGQSGDAFVHSAATPKAR